MEIVEIKSQLIAAARSVVEDRIEQIQTAITAARETAHNETKSSSGDKYETTRAMMHLEMEKLGTQLSEAQQSLQALQSIPITASVSTGPGSIIKTDHGNYFISISAGLTKADGESYFLISPVAPIARAFLSASIGNTIELNSRKYTIQEIL